MPTLTVVVLAYNEALNLAAAVEEISASLDGLPCVSELLIVDDGSTDGTADEAERLAADHKRIRVVHHTTNLGLGGGYRTGFLQAQGEFITFFPADGQFPATIIPQFMALMPSCDMVLGVIPRRPDSWWPKALSAGERALYRIVLGKVPRFQGILMFRRSLLDAVRLESTGRGWAVLLEFIIKCSRNGCRLMNAPIPCRPRRSGDSKVNNMRTIRSNLGQVFGLRRSL